MDLSGEKDSVPRCERLERLLTERPAELAAALAQLAREPQSHGYLAQRVQDSREPYERRIWALTQMSWEIGISNDETTLYKRVETGGGRFVVELPVGQLQA